MSKNISQETIEQYLSKQLSGDALVGFKAKMETDPEFRKEVKMQGLIYRGVNKFGEAEMRSKLKNIRAQVLDKEGVMVANKLEQGDVIPMSSRKKTKLIFRWSMAAAIALAIGACIYFIANNRTASADDLFASYYVPYSENISVRNATTESIADRASQLYKAKNYEAALPLFIQVLESEPDNAEIQLVIGISQMELSRFEKANQTFSAINNPLYDDQAKWYLAMNFLKQNDVVSARTVLQSILPVDYNYTKAQEILAKIRTTE